MKHQLIYKKKSIFICDNKRRRTLWHSELPCRNDGQLFLLNKCLDSVEGTGCYISVSDDGDYLFEAVYGAGIIRLYELDSSTGEVVRLIEELKHNYKTGPNERQDHPHVHYAHQTPDKKFVAACDLGTDRIVSYSFNKMDMM